MDTPVIHYVTGLPVYITIGKDGDLTVTVDLSEGANDLQFEGMNAYLDDEPVDEYNDYIYARIERVLRNTGYEATITIPEDAKAPCPDCGSEWVNGRRRHASTCRIPENTTN